MKPAVDLSFLRSRAAWRRIGMVTLAFALAGVAYGLLAPRWYRSVLTVVPAKQQKGGISGLMGGMDLGGLAAGLDSAMGGADAPRIAAVLQSIAVTDAVIAKFDLRARYRERYQETTRDELWRHCDVKTLPKPNLVQLTCEDKDPRFVQEMLEYFADYGNQVFKRVSSSSASEEVHFLEKHVADLRAAADETSERMRQFQEEHRIVDLDTQAKAVVSAMASLNAQRISKQLELDYARTFSAGDEPAARQLRSQLGVVAERLRDLEGDALDPAPAPAGAPTGSAAGGKGGSVAQGTFPAAMMVPRLRAEYEKLYRDRKVAEATLVFALERLEAAKANEARNASTFLVLDPPALPTRHVRPKRLLTIIGATLVGLVGSLAYVWAMSGGARMAASLVRPGVALSSGSKGD